MNDLEGFKTLLEEVTADAVEITRELNLAVEPENVTELLQSHDKPLAYEQLLLMDDQRKWFLEMKPTPSENATEMLRRLMK